MVRLKNVRKHLRAAAECILRRIRQAVNGCLHQYCVAPLASLVDGTPRCWDRPRPARPAVGERVEDGAVAGRAADLDLCTATQRSSARRLCWQNSEAAAATRRPGQLALLTIACHSLRVEK